MLVYIHDPGCARTNHSDAAKRLYDVYNLHYVALQNKSYGKWFAVALKDGRSDGILYDSKAACVAHQKHNEMYYAYTQIIPSSMSVCEAERFLYTHRVLYRVGFRVTDPNAKDLIRRTNTEDEISLVRSIRDGTRPGNLIFEHERN